MLRPCGQRTQKMQELKAMLMLRTQGPGWNSWQDSGARPHRDMQTKGDLARDACSQGYIQVEKEKLSPISRFGREFLLHLVAFVSFRSRICPLLAEPSASWRSCWSLLLSPEATEKPSTDSHRDLGAAGGEPKWVSEQPLHPASWTNPYA